MALITRIPIEQWDVDADGTYRPLAGEHLDHACEEACALAVLRGTPVTMSFNGTVLTATPHSTPDKLFLEYFVKREGDRR